MAHVAVAERAIKPGQRDMALMGKVGMAGDSIDLLPGDLLTVFLKLTKPRFPLSPEGCLDAHAGVTFQAVIDRRDSGKGLALGLHMAGRAGETGREMPLVIKRDRRLDDQGALAVGLSHRVDHRAHQHRKAGDQKEAFPHANLRGKR